MPLDTRVVSQATEAITHEVDARWIMAYAAGLGDFNTCYVDTAAAPPVAHPAFPVCLEWPAVLASRKLPGSETLSQAERARGVHAAHDLHLYRPIQPGDRLTTRATVIGLKRIKPGAAQTLRLDTVDAEGQLVCRTYQLGISRGVDIVGEAVAAEEPPPLPSVARQEASAGSRWESIGIPVPEGLAHIYTECARIWNPIHTDRAVALAAGLPDIILHGTATMALAATRLVNGFLDGDPRRVTRLGGRFSAMVLMPSALTLEVLGHEAGTLFFEVRTESGEVTFSQGFLCYA